MLFGIAAIFCSMAYFGSISSNTHQNLLTKSPSSDEDALNSTLPNLSMFREQSNQFCKRNGTGTTNASDTCADEVSTEDGRVGAATGYTTTAFCIMAIGLMIQGMMKGPRVSLSSIFIDDNDVSTKTAMYVGVISCLAVFGPALAYGFGGFFARIYVTLEDVPITTNDPRWVGAWWAGFILFGGMTVISGVPLLCFPRRLQPHVNIKPKKSATSIQGTLKDFIVNLFRIIRNPVYMLNTLSGCLEVFVISASLSFTPKYLETQYSLSVWQANLFMGVVAMVSAGFGTLLGGYLVSKFKCSPLTCVKCYMAAKLLFGLSHATDYLTGCPNPTITNYNIQTGINNSCSSGCFCDVTDYFPICGSDGRNYFSPCQAGCTGRENLEYIDCACIGVNATALPGLCPSDCNMVYGFGTSLMVGAFIGTLGVMPHFIVTLRSVHDKQKPMAIGLQSFLHSTLGWMPAPVLFGMIVDSSCKVWSSSCKGQGACAMYDIEDFRIKRATFELICCALLICLQCLLFILARKKNWSTGTPVTDVISKPEVEGLMGNELHIVEVSPSKNQI